VEAMTAHVTTAAQPGPLAGKDVLGHSLFSFLYGDLRLDDFDSLAPLTVGDVALQLRDREGQGFKDLRLRIATILRWYQTLGTPVGYYFHSVVQAQAQLLQQGCLRIARERPSYEFRVPFYQWLGHRPASADGSEGDGTRELTNLFLDVLRVWLIVENGLAVMQGGSVASLREARSLLQMKDRLLGGTEELSIISPLGSNSLDKACPTVEGRPIGAATAWRGAESIASLLFFVRLDLAMRKAEASFDTLVDIPKGLADIPLAPLLAEAGLPVFPTDESTMLTLLAAVDLAMFSPMHPLFSPLREGLRWDDLHPGYRLQRIFSLIERDTVVLAETDPAAWQEFSSTLCSKLGWPDVSAFVEIVAAREDLAGGRGADRFFHALTKRRLEHPCAFFDPLLACEVLSDIPPLAWQVADTERAPNLDNALALAMEGELYGLAYQLFFADQEPAFLCPVIGEGLEVFESSAEMLENYFGLSF
jgi:hypothetical protein